MILPMAVQGRAWLLRTTEGNGEQREELGTAHPQSEAL